MFEELIFHSRKLLLVFLSATRTLPAAISGFVKLNWKGNIRQGPAALFWVRWFSSTYFFNILFLLALIVKIARKNRAEIRSRMVKHVDQQKSIQIIQKRNLGFGNDWTYFRGKVLREILQYYNWSFSIRCFIENTTLNKRRVFKWLNC